MKAELVCPHCGTRNPPESNFCNRCGAALTAEMETTARDPAAPLDPRAEPGDFDAGGPGADAPHTEPFDESAPGDATQGESAWPGEFWGTPPAQPQEIVLFPDDQVLGGGQGYLESVAIAGEAVAAEGRDPAGDAVAAPGDIEHWRAVRTLMREEPQLAAAPVAPAPFARNYRPLWLVLLMLAAALLPFLVDAQGAPPPSVMQSGSALRSAYDTIHGLAIDDVVLVFWQYDPATAGELDLVALPVVSDLLERGIRSQVVSLLPTGLASARRLYDNAVRGLDESAMKAVVAGWMGGGTFLTGGTAALPLLAQQGGQSGATTPGRSTAPTLALVVAAQSDDVRHWLEIVQPVNRLPVVAVTTAAADPLLLPYVESGQLAGLVSGFDGAAAYQSMRAEPLAPAAQRRQELVTQAQNWGALALLLVLLAGNLARLFWRERRG